MSNAIEIEAKVLLEEEDYKKLAHLFRSEPRYTQTNYYIDNEKRLLAEEGIALRIREKEGHYELTLKTPLSQGLLEKNENITEEMFKAYRDQGIFPKGDTARFLTMLDIDVKSLKILTSLTTERIDVDYEGGLLSIDRNHYSGHIDYEVEFEYNNMTGSEEILKKLLDDNGIPCLFNNATKVHRAMAAIGK